MTFGLKITKEVHENIINLGWFIVRVSSLKSEYHDLAAECMFYYHFTFLHNTHSFYGHNEYRPFESK